MTVLVNKGVRKNFFWLSSGPENKTSKLMGCEHTRVDVAGDSLWIVRDSDGMYPGNKRDTEHYDHPQVSTYEVMVH